MSFRSARVSWPDTVKNGERKGECKRTDEREKEKRSRDYGVARAKQRSLRTASNQKLGNLMRKSVTGAALFTGVLSTALLFLICL